MVDTDARSVPDPAVGPARLPGRTGLARRGGTATVATVVALALLGLAGCGGDKSDDESDGDGSVLTATDAAAADRVVKDGAVNVMESVESCHVGSGDYGVCERRDQIGATTLEVVPRDPAAAQATISRGTRTGYRILTVSLSGNRFAITRQGSQVIRSCVARTPLGRSGGGCKGNGW